MNLKALCSLPVFSRRVLTKTCLPARQALLIMKFTAILLFAACLQVSAKGYSQITLSEKNVPLQKVFKQIQQQTGYDFLYSVELLQRAGKVSIDLHNASIEKALELCLRDKPLAYSIIERTVIIKPKEEKTTVTIIEATPPPIEVKGRVVNEKGEPLEGITVAVKGSKKATATDKNGEFVLTELSENAVLIFTGTNIEAYETPLNGRTFIAVFVKNKIVEGQEVSVVATTGYQQISRERATGSYDVVGRDILDKRPVSNISSALQGLVAGLQGSENLDGSVQFLIRGTSTLYGTAQPLVVVDGFPIIASNFSDINPNDVESITVLKDAAAASIWGARSANGVIVITTKKGKLSRSKLNVEVNAFTRVSNMIDLDQVMSQASSAQQVEYEKLAYQRKLFFPPTPYIRTFQDIIKPQTLVGELYSANGFGVITTDQLNQKLDSLKNINNRDQFRDLIMRNGLLSQINVNLSSATDRSRTYTSFLFENRKEGFQKRGYDRFLVNFNNQFQPASFITFNIGANLQYKKSESSGAEVEELQQLSPYESLRKTDGSYSVNLNGVNREQVSLLPSAQFPYQDWSYNLLREVNGRKITSEEINVRLQASMNIRLMAGLNFETRFQFEKLKSETENYQGEETFFVRNLANTMVNYNNVTRVVANKYVPNGGILRKSSSDLQSYVVRNQLNFNRTFKSRHSVAAIAGMEVSRYLSVGTSYPWLYGYFPDKNQSTVPQYGYGTSVATLKNILGQTATLNGGSTIPEWNLDKYVSFYSNASYTYDSKYTISASARSDASNYITDDPKLRWSPFWSVGGLWNIRKENFMKNTRIIDRLSLRATYGKNGNTEKSSSTKPLVSVSTSPSTTTGTIIATIADNGNPFLKWERTTTTNIGVDYSLLKNKIFGKVDWYKRLGQDITGLVQLPAVTGTTSQRFNNAEISNTGIEIELGANLNIGKHFNYRPMITYAYNKNEIRKLFFPNITASTMINGTFVQGRPVSSLYSYTYLGMTDSVPYIAGPKGVPVSMNTTGVLSLLGKDFLNYEGTGTPPHTLGFVNNISYRNFSLFMVFIGKFGGVYRNPAFLPVGVGSNKIFVNRTVEDVLNGSTAVPQFPKYQEPNFYLWDRYIPFLDGLVESSSYLEFKEASLQYAIPAKLIKGLAENNLKIYVQVRDIGIMWRANSKGYHPEWLPGTNRPVTSYTFGINWKL